MSLHNDGFQFKSGDGTHLAAVLAAHAAVGTGFAALLSNEAAAENRETIENPSVPIDLYSQFLHPSPNPSSL